MPDDVVGCSEDRATGFSPGIGQDANLLARMEVGAIGYRTASGHVASRRLAPLDCLLYGPFLRLPSGRYRVRFRCRLGIPLRRDQPVLALEVIAQNRVQQGWRDFLAGELADGGALEFDVPPTLGIEADGDMPFEFRLLHFANARVVVTSVEVQRLGPAGFRAPEPRVWRLLGRLHLRALPVELGGTVSLSRLTPLHRLSDRCTPHLRLPAGRYRLAMHGRPGLAAGRAALAAEVVTRDGDVLAQDSFSVTGLAAPEGGTLEFVVPPELSMECGATLCIDVRLRQSHRMAVRLTAVDLHLLDQDRLPDAKPVPPASGGSPALAGRAKLVVIGNCQAGLVTTAFRENLTLRARFRTIYHEARLQPNQLEQGRRDLAGCAVVLVQDIKDWQTYPLRDHVPTGAQVISFPCLRFASLWPFDSYNGMEDREARLRDHPNFEFTYFDGLLGRLRRDIPDRQARFAAYRALAVEGLVDCRALHRFEAKRLAAMDRTFGAGIGAYILENFRDRQLFYTTAHPNAELFAMMLRQITRQLGITTRVRRRLTLDTLRDTQIPVHPEVAHRLGVRWATATTRYAYRGGKVTWEEYVSRYIAYYG